MQSLKGKESNEQRRKDSCHINWLGGKAEDEHYGGGKKWASIKNENENIYKNTLTSSFNC